MQNKLIPSQEKQVFRANIPLVSTPIKILFVILHKLKNLYL